MFQDEDDMSKDIPAEYIESAVDAEVLKYDDKCPGAYQDVDMRDVSFLFSMPILTYFINYCIYFF